MGFAKQVIVVCSLFLPLSITSCGWCQTPAEGTQASKAFHSGEVNVQFSRVYVHAFKTGFGHEHAVEGHLQSGNLNIANPTEPGSLTFDMQSFDADGPRARKYIGLTGETDASTRKQVNDNLRGAEVLDIHKYPTAKFEIDQIRALGARGTEPAGEFELSGRFTLHGETRPLVLTVQVSKVKGWNHVQGQFKIKQSDYGIKPFSKAFGAVGVADELVIMGDLFVAP